MKTDRARRVYVVQRAAFWNRKENDWEDIHDISSATEYGNIVYLLKPGNISKDLEKSVALLSHRLSDYEDGDHLLTMGDPVAIGMATSIAGHFNEGRVGFLKWDRLDQCYYAYSVQLPHFRI